MLSLKLDMQVTLIMIEFCMIFRNWTFRVASEYVLSSQKSVSYFWSTESERYQINFWDDIIVLIWLCLPRVYNPCNNLRLLPNSGWSAKPSITINIWNICFVYFSSDNQQLYSVYQLHFPLLLDCMCRNIEVVHQYYSVLIYLQCACLTSIQLGSILIVGGHITNLHNITVYIHY